MATPPDFSTGQVLTAAHMDAVGMWLVKAENSVTATNASPYGVQSVFTSDYRNYRLMWYASQATANASFSIQFYTGTNTPYTSAFYNYGWGGSYVSAGPVYGFGGFSASNPFAPDTLLYLGSSIASTYSAHGWLDIYAPQTTTSTRVAGQAFTPYTGVYYNTALHGTGAVEASTQFTGFRFIPSAGTTTITYRLYGYRD